VTFEEAKAAALAAPLPALAKRSARARHILARLGVLTLLAGAGCVGHPLQPRVQSALDVLECQLDAAEELVPSVVVAAQVVLAMRSGDAEGAALALAQLGMSVPEMTAVAKGLKACMTP
jgi:hypothetical protein